MRHIKDIYPIVNEVRQRIIETMQQRGLTKIEIIPTREEYDKQHENDPDWSDLDWDELRAYTCPAVTYYNKHSCGESYDVISVELVNHETTGLHLKLNCVGEFQDDWFYDYDVTNESMYGVYEEMEKSLGIDKEPEYVWVFTATQACDAQAFDIITEVFATEEAAHKHMHDFVYSEDGELAFAEKRGWTIEANTPDYFQAYEEGYYNGNHTEAQINKFEVKH